MLTSGWCTTLFKWWICAERKKEWQFSPLVWLLRRWRAFLSVPLFWEPTCFIWFNLNSAWIMSHHPVRSWPTRFRHNTYSVRFRKRPTLGFKQDANYSLYPSIEVLGSMGINGSICWCYKGNKMKVDCCVPSTPKKLCMRLQFKGPKADEPPLGSHLLIDPLTPRSSGNPTGLHTSSHQYCTESLEKTSTRRRSLYQRIQFLLTGLISLTINLV